MNTEEKELLLKDLCARLPYGVVMQAVIGKPRRRREQEVLNTGNFRELISISRRLPILFPIECLTKPITIASYNDGEPFVPIIEMARLAMPNIQVGRLPDYMDISSQGRMEVVFRIGQGEYFAFDAANQSFVYGICNQDEKYRTFTVNNQRGLFDCFEKWHINYRLPVHVFVPVTETFNPYK